MVGDYSSANVCQSGGAVNARYREVVDWIRERYAKPWQRDALRRVVQQPAVQATDIAELTEMVRGAAGLPTSQQVAPRDLELPPGAPGVGAQPRVGAPVALASMHSLKDVNALATGQTIKFALEGLTVVYGENGAGKTGYSRVLRRACRQWREKDVEGIRPNVRTPSPGVPEATFDVAVGDQRRSVTWRQGAKAPAELAGLAVFDTRCVPAIIAEENAVTYQPEELRLMTCSRRSRGRWAGRLRAFALSLR